MKKKTKKKVEVEQAGHLSWNFEPVLPIDTRPIELYEEQIKSMELHYGNLFDSCIKKIDEMQKVGVRFMKESFAEGYFWGFMSGALLVILMVFIATTLSK